MSQERERLDSARQKVSRQNVGRTDDTTTTLHVPLFRGIVQEADAPERDRHRLQRYDEACGEQGPGDGSDRRRRDQTRRQQGSGNESERSGEEQESGDGSAR